MKNDQKTVIRDEVVRLIDRYHLHSLLDIGAGGSGLTAELASYVDRYCAIEVDKERVAELRDNDLYVVASSFPDVSISEPFDLVLSSHSIPERVNEYENFVKKAWELTSTGGVLVFITLKGTRGDMDMLRRTLRDSHWRDADKEKYLTLIKCLNDYEFITEYQIQSSTMAEDVEEMVTLLTFSIGGTETEKRKYKPTLKKIIQEQYFDESQRQYIFPHQHNVLLVHK